MQKAGLRIIKKEIRKELIFFHNILSIKGVPQTDNAHFKATPITDKLLSHFV